MTFSFFSLCAFVLLFLSNSVHANAETLSLYLHTPGTELGSAPGRELASDVPKTAPPPPMLLKRAWYAVSLDGSTLVLNRSVTTRAPDWQIIESSTSTRPQASTEKLNPLAPTRHALAMPETAVLAFRLEDWDSDKAIPFKAGRYPSVLPLPVILHDRWNASFQVNGKKWTAATESVRRKDGALLAGSLQLVATSDTGEKLVLVPPAHGMAFQRQELLWVGSLQSTSQVDVLVKRTWITGEIDYVLRIGKTIQKSDPIDLDYPYTYSSSGADESEKIVSHISQKRRGRPDGQFGGAAFSISEESWNQALDKAAEQMLPKVLFSRQLMLGSEKMRITIEYLPRLGYPSEPSYPVASFGSMSFSGGPILVKAHFRGKSQVLLQTHRLDSSSFDLRLGMHDGEPAILIPVDYDYNNSFVYYWVWGDAEGRFLRLSQEHSQGC